MGTLEELRHFRVEVVIDAPEDVQELVLGEEGDEDLVELRDVLENAVQEGGLHLRERQRRNGSRS